jgi:hypothetical protein
MGLTMDMFLDHKVEEKALGQLTAHRRLRNGVLQDWRRSMVDLVCQQGFSS